MTNLQPPKDDEMICEQCTAYGKDANVKAVLIMEGLCRSCRDKLRKLLDEMDKD